MEEEVLDYYGDIEQCDKTHQMDIIQQDDFFDIIALDSVRFSGEDYEKRVDALIYSAYVSNLQDGETMSNTTM